MSNNTDTKPILVLRSTGKTGRRVVERLRARGIPTRAGVRSAQPPFDWDDGDTWAPVLQGAGAVYRAAALPRALPGAEVADGVERARLTAA